MSVVKTLRIDSYFSLPTDLAAEMRSWREFLTGNGYDVHLRDAATGEEVSVQFQKAYQESFVVISGAGGGDLFDRAVGRVVVALSENSDSLLLRRYDDSSLRSGS